MLRTVEEYREWYRRRLLAILARIRAGRSPSGGQDGATWRALLDLALRLLVALVLVGGVLPGAASVLPRLGPLLPTSPLLSAGPVLSRPESAAPAVSEPRSFYTVERSLADYMLLEGHAKRGPPLVWGYLFDRQGCKDAMVLVEFKDGWVARFGYADPASLPPQGAPPSAGVTAPVDRPALEEGTPDR